MQEKFKEGDEVEILSFEELKEQACKDVPNNYESLYFPYCTFKLNEHMKQHCGRKTKIVEAFDEYEVTMKRNMPCYRLEIDSGEWSWMGQWLRKVQ